MNWGAKYGYIWAGSSFCCALFFFFFLPELKGRALEEIDELFERKVPAWKFKSAETSIVSDAIKEVRQRGEVGEDRGKASTVEIVRGAREGGMTREGIVWFGGCQRWSSGKG